MRRFLFAAFALMTFSISAPALADDAAWGEWRWLPDYDAVFTEADAIAPNSAVKPRLVVVCNNLVRITYLEWPTDLGIEKRDDLPKFVEVDFAMRPLGDGTELWFVD
ncbi:MAG: hypothetical protein R3360_05085, partial [Alphaproteobacteria bacterium]|nr:hypothetical protein [Alphaproteobacteria bacterium]